MKYQPLIDLRLHKLGQRRRRTEARNQVGPEESDDRRYDEDVVPEVEVDEVHPGGRRRRDAAPGGRRGFGLDAPFDDRIGDGERDLQRTED